MMGLQNFVIYLLLVLTYCHCLTNASTCEDTETAHVKLDLAKQSIHSAKFLFPQCESETNNSNCSVKDRSLAHLNAALDLISEAKLMCHTCHKFPHAKPIDCSEILYNGFNKSDVYQIGPKAHGFIPNESIHVYCDMETDGGGWTVIQRRGDFKPQRDFYQDWESYKKGFGDIKREFWLGNDNIHTLSNQGRYQIRFDLQAIDGTKAFATYDNFWIENEENNYKLHIANYSGNAGDSMEVHNQQMFSTKDRKNDESSDASSCSSWVHGAWWYRNCAQANLNGLYQPGKKGDQKSIFWGKWKNNEGLSATEMKIRKKEFPRSK